MTKLKIGIIDDSLERIEDMERSIKGAGGKGHTFTEIHGEKVDDLVDEIRKRMSGENHSAHELDTCDLVLVDHDLSSLEGQSGFLKGAWLAQQIRMYVHCGPIVAVDRWPIRTFMLRPEPNEGLSADVFLHIDDLKVPGLWTEKRGHYDPWYWPNLIRLAHDYVLRCSRVEEAFDSPMPEVLEVNEYDGLLPPEHPHLPADMTAYTPKELVTSLNTGRSVRLEEKYRIAATAMGSWLNWDVAPKQSHLIDAPHLTTICPGLLDVKPTKNNLNKLVDRNISNLPLNADLLEDHHFAASYWCDRPLWWTRTIMADNRIPDIQEPWYTKKLELVFAEDKSQWISEKSAIPYSADGRFKRRYVAGAKAVGAPEIAYEPRGRLGS